MAIIVDINCLGYVFNSSDQRHDDFEPIKAFVTKGKGALVFGGSKYKEELSLMSKYTGLINNLRSQGRVKFINDEIVDAHTERVRKATEGTDCDDPHIIGIVAASNCRLLCSVDQRSYPYIKDKKLYPKRESSPPTIYKGRGNVGVLKQQRAKLRNAY